MQLQVSHTEKIDLIKIKPVNFIVKKIDGDWIDMQTCAFHEFSQSIFFLRKTLRIYLTL